MSLFSGKTFWVLAASRSTLGAFPAGLVVLALLALSGCNGAASGAFAPSPAPVTSLQGATIVATTGHVAEMVRAVVGSRATVTQLMNAGVDPHLFSPSRQHVSRIVSAQVIVASGLHLEGRLQGTLERLRDQGRHVLTVGELLPRDQLRSADDGAHFDPHVWMNPRLWAQAVVPLAERLGELDPAHAAEFRANAEAYVSTLETVDGQVRALMDSIPREHRVLVTAHDAFAYFGEAYGVDVTPIQGLSTESEAGVSDVSRVVTTVVSRRVPAIFFESSMNPKTVAAVQEGARAQGVDVVLGEELFSDSLGPADTPAGTYTGMLLANAQRIARGLNRHVAASPSGLPPQ